MKHLFPIIMWTAYSKFLSTLNSYPTQTVQFPEISTNSVLLLWVQNNYKTKAKFSM